MTTPGQRTAKPPISPHANLAAADRIGATKHGSAIWRLACECGKTVEADAPTIKRGAARCPDCNPACGTEQAEKILAALPATIGQIMQRTGMTLGAVMYRLSTMKPHLCHTGKWRRSRSQGAYQPIIVAGCGEDVPCPLKRRSRVECERRYRKRVKKVVAKALASGGTSVRYTRLIARRRADEIAARTRVTPQTWMSALMQ
jgi:hypothetical protein